VLPDFHLIDKLLHFSAWLLLGCLFFRAYRAYFPVSHFKKRVLWISFLSATLYGISDETHQYFIPARTAEVLDVVADAAGSLCGSLMGAWWYANHRPPAAVKNIDSPPIRSIDKSA